MTAFTTPSYNYEGVPIHAIYARKEAYNSYPTCQRDYVWSVPMQQKLIDSILRGLPIPPITILPATEHALMGTRFWIVDGQQRLKTILRFRDNEFKTAKNFSLEPGQRPMQPNCSYDQLSAEAQDGFDFYALQICQIRNVDSQDTGLIYRRFNYQMALKFAEQLYSYEGKAKPLAEKLFDHPFWRTIYAGNSDRKQIFAMAMHCIYMEIMGILANMTSPQLVDLARGSKDNKLTPQLYDKIFKSLTGVQNVFDGATFISMGEIIPIYQAGLLLERDGYDLHKSTRGCLAFWYMQFRELALSSRKEGASNPIGVLTNLNRQWDFWQKNLPKIFDIAGDELLRRDKKRDFDELDKIKAWNKQKGKCPICRKPVHINDVGHHAEAHTAGGKTTADNCILLHKACHDSMHNNPKFPSLA
jgi:hypothetical protein